MERATATGAREFRSLPLALAGGWAEAPAFTHALAEAFALLRGHVRAALGHAIGQALFYATADTGATGTVPSKPAEEDPAQQQEPKQLQKSKLAPAEEMKKFPIRLLQQFNAAHSEKQQQPKKRQRTYQN